MVVHYWLALVRPTLGKFWVRFPLVVGVVAVPLAFVVGWLWCIFIKGGQYWADNDQEGKEE
jgi:hypothetical protein